MFVLFLAYYECIFLFTRYSNIYRNNHYDAGEKWENKKVKKKFVNWKEISMHIVQSMKDLKIFLKAPLKMEHFWRRQRKAWWWIGIGGRGLVDGGKIEFQIFLIFKSYRWKISIVLKHLRNNRSCITY